LPDAFLRRCFFHYINFPDVATMRRIVAVHYPHIREEILAAALRTFFALRDAPGLKKKPSTSEFLDWLQLLADDSVPATDIESNTLDVPPLAGALLKNEQDLTLLRRLADMARANQRR
jgi:MoxR-like ATPase